MIFGYSLLWIGEQENHYEGNLETSVQRQNSGAC